MPDAITITMFGLHMARPLRKIYTSVFELWTLWTQKDTFLGNERVHCEHVGDVSCIALFYIFVFHLVQWLQLIWRYVSVDFVLTRTSEYQYRRPNNNCQATAPRQKI